MIRITRFVAKSKICDLINFDHVCKVTIPSHKNKNLKNPAICKVDIYLIVGKGREDSMYHTSKMVEIQNWANKNKNNTALTTATMAIRDGFIKESAFDDFPYPMPEKYQILCKLYGDKFFKCFNNNESII